MIRHIALIFCINLALAAFSGGPARAESPSDEPRQVQLTKAELVEEALGNNSELKSLEQSISAAEGEVVIARKWENPELSLTPAWKRLPASGEDSERNTFKGTFELGQLIEYPGKRVLRKSIAEKEVDAAKLALSGFRYQLQTKVEKTFYELILSQEIRKLREEQVRAGETFFQANKERADSGYASDVETVRAQAELITAKKAAGEAESAHKQSTIELNILLGRDASSPLAVSGSVDELPDAIPRSNVIERVLAENPNIRAQMLVVEKFQLATDAAKLSRNPDLTAGPSIEYSDDEQVYGVTLSVPLPLWDDKSGEIQKASAEAIKARAELETLRREVTAAALTASEKLRAAHEQVALFSPAFRKQLKASMEQAEKSYATTGTTVLLYLDAKRTYFDTLAEYYNSLDAVLEAQSELQAAAGAPIEFQTTKNK